MLKFKQKGKSIDNILVEDTDREITVEGTKTLKRALRIQIYSLFGG